MYATGFLVFAGTRGGNWEAYGGLRMLLGESVEFEGGSIIDTDEHSHLEPVRYPAGSGVFRPLAMPHAPGDTILERFGASLGVLLREPLRTLKAWLTPDWGKHTMILLYMRTVEGTSRMKLGRGIRSGWRRGVTTTHGTGPQAKASIPEATELAKRV